MRPTLSKKELDLAHDKGWTLSSAILKALDRDTGRVRALIERVEREETQGGKPWVELQAVARSHISTCGVARSISCWINQHGTARSRNSNKWAALLPDSHLEASWNHAMGLLRAFVDNEGTMERASQAEIETAFSGVRENVRDFARRATA